MYEGAITFVRGDDETVRITFNIDAIGTPLDITGRTYVMNIRVCSDAAALFSAAGVVTGALGLVVFTFAAVTTAQLTDVVYEYVWRDTSNGTTFGLGPLRVAP